MEKANLKHPCYAIPKSVLDKIDAEKAAEAALTERLNPHNTRAEVTAWLHSANIKIKEIIKTLKRGGFKTERKNRLKDTSGNYIFTVNGKEYKIYARARRGCIIVIEVNRKGCLILDSVFIAIEANKRFIEDADPYIFELFGLTQNNVPIRN